MNASSPHATSSTTRAFNGKKKKKKKKKKKNWHHNISLPPEKEDREKKKKKKPRLKGVTANTSARSADGTTLISTNSLNEVSAFVLPADLLSRGDGGKQEPRLIEPQWAPIKVAEPITSNAPAPYFALGDANTYQTLVSCSEQPIQLHSLARGQGDESSSTIRSSYFLVHQVTESYLTAASLLWPGSGRTFFAGSTNLVALFDASVDGSEPVAVIPTIPSRRHKLKGGGVGMKGVVSALGCQFSSRFARSWDEGNDYPPHAAATAAIPSSSSSTGSEVGLLAAGTRSSHLAIYDPFRSPHLVGTLSVARAARSIADVGGSGITQTIWSPCGTYLVVAERRSTGMLVYDVRSQGKLLSWLSGREDCGNEGPSGTQVRTADVFPGSHGSGFEVWAGNSNGAVKVWEGVGTREGEMVHAWAWKAHGDGVSVGAATLHATGSVVATCSGNWAFADEPGTGGPSRGNGEPPMKKNKPEKAGSSSCCTSTSEEQSCDKSKSICGSSSVERRIVSHQDCRVSVWSVDFGSP